MIYDFDDPKTIEGNDPTCQIFCWKGEPQMGWGDKTRPGADLQDRLRLEIGDKSLRDRLYQIYSSRGDYIEQKELVVSPQGARREVKKTFLYVKHLNIYLAYDHWQRSFYTEMRKQKGRQIEWRCNRRQIYEQSERYTDYKDNVRYRGVACDRPCQADPQNPYLDCPAGCQRYGDLYFYIWEFDDFNCYPLCRLRTKAYCDHSTIPRALKQIYENYGSVCTSPEDMGMVFKYAIPFTLARMEVPIDRPVTEQKQLQGGKKVYLRTGKKVEDSAWGLSLMVKPEWTQMLAAKREMLRLRRIGAAPSRQVLTAAYQDAIDVDATPIHQLPPDRRGRDVGGSLRHFSRPRNPVSMSDIVAQACSDDLYLEQWKPTEQDVQNLRSLFLKHQWGKQEIIKLLAKYGKQPKDVASLSREEFEIITKEAQTKPLITTTNAQDDSAVS